MFSNKLCPLTFTAVLCLFLSANSQASERLNFSGFGTLGYAITDSDTAEYRTGKAQDGADDRGSFEVDTRLGVQADFMISHNSSATLQLLAREGGDGDPEVEAGWAFLKKQINDSVGVRVGRIGLGLYMASEFQEVGFAHPLLRPPEETYVQVPLYSLDGIDIIGNIDIGETQLTFQLIAGQTKTKFFDDLDIDAKFIGGINITAETDHWRWRITHNEGSLSVTSANLLALGEGLSQASVFLPELADIAEDFNDEYKDVSFSGIGVEYEQEKLFLQAELTTRTVDQFLPDTTAWYVVAGYRFGSFAPYAYFSQLRQNSKESIDFPDVPQLQEAAASVENIYASADQQSVAVGLRWDFRPNIAFKAQVEHLDFNNNGVSFSREGGAGLVGEDSANLYSVALDFIF
ncbi:MAG: porin [Granulosicoccus sp.]